MSSCLPKCVCFQRKFISKIVYYLQVVSYQLYILIRDTDPMGFPQPSSAIQTSTLPPRDPSAWYALQCPSPSHCHPFPMPSKRPRCSTGQNSSISYTPWTLTVSIPQNHSFRPDPRSEVVWMQVRVSFWSSYWCVCPVVRWRSCKVSLRFSSVVGQLWTGSWQTLRIHCVGYWWYLFG